MRTFPPTHRSVPQGRRLSVAPTTARRFPSARRRPGVGFFPARVSAARVGSGESPGTRFRIYDEDEFFSRLDGATGGASPAPLDLGDEPALGPRAVCGIAAAGISLAVVLVVSLNLAVPLGGARRKAALHAARAQASDANARKLDRRPRHRSRARPRSARLPRAARLRARLRPSTSARHAATVSAVAERPGTTRDESTNASSPASDVSTAGAVVDHPGGVRREAVTGEFGFER